MYHFELCITFQNTQCQFSLQTLANPSSASTVALVCLCRFYILFHNIYVTMQHIVTQRFGSSVTFQFILTKSKYYITFLALKKQNSAV